MTPLSTVESKKVEWLWENRIPANMLSLLVGNPDAGKSFLTMLMAATLTTSRDWPDCKNMNPAGAILFFSDEESMEYAIKPRLEANGADCNKVFVFDHIKTKDGEREFFNIQDSIAELDAYLDKVTDCRAIILDPITAYLGRADANSNADVRGVLLGLQDLAERRRITVIGVSHLSKKSDLSVIHRVLGSIGFVAAARSVWAVATEQNEGEITNPPWRLMLPVKSNYSIDPNGLRFQIVEGAVVFDKNPIRQNIDDVLQKSGMEAKAKKKAKKWLQGRLEGGDVPSTELLEDAKEQGISEWALRAAGKELKARCYKIGVTEGWAWTLSPQDEVLNA